MSGDSFGQLAYLVILGTAVVGWYIAENRRNLGRSARMFVAWGLIFLGVIAGYGLWSDIRDEVLPRQSVVASGALEVPRANDGHYHLVAKLNGVPVQFVVDTGASDVVLTQDDARRIGLDPGSLAFGGIANTANGPVRIANARVDSFELGGNTDTNVRVSVNGGEMNGSLLGMSYLQRFAHIEISGNKLILTR